MKDDGKILLPHHPKFAVGTQVSLKDSQGRPNHTLGEWLRRFLEIAKVAGFLAGFWKEWLKGQDFRSFFRKNGLRGGF